MKNVKQILVGASCLLLCGMAMAQAQPQPQSLFETPVKVNIKAQSMSAALNEFAAQTGLQLLFHVESVMPAELTAPVVVGALTPKAALTKLLANTELRYVLINERTVEIRSAKQGSTPKDAVEFLPTSSSLNLDANILLLAQAEDKEAQAVDQQKNGKKSSRVDAEGVEEMIVKESKIRPFSDSNVDRPRTINDEQPYYIFDAQTIERSGAVTVEDFLKTRLTMNTVALTNSQDPLSFNGNTSSINLRGLGTDKTLILVNGRRVPGVVYQTLDYQPDINGIPMSAIDRIEVLPSSASGIYGGSAIGGVINIVLKRDYAGGEVRLAYDNTWKSDAPTRRVSMTFGQSLEDGKTNFMITGQWSEAQPLYFADRSELMVRGLQNIMQNSPSSFYSSTSPFLGAAPNITSAAYRDPVTNILTPDPGTLTLKDGRALNSRNTTVPLGTAAGTSIATLSDLLLQNAGRWNLNMPLTTQSPTGLLRPLSSIPTVKSAAATVRRQMTSGIEFFMEFSYGSNHTDSLADPPLSSILIPAAAQINPFNSAITVRFPSGNAAPRTTDSVSRSLTAGANFKFPGSWMGRLDYNKSKNEYSYSFLNPDTTLATADILSGVLNPFRDTVLYPVDFSRYRFPIAFAGSSYIDAVALRTSGPLFQLYSGAPTLTVGLEHRVGRRPEGKRYRMNHLAPTTTTITTYFAREQATDSGYAELQVPLVAINTMPLLYALDLQLSGRSERYKVDAGTPTYVEYPFNPSQSAYGSPRLPDGQPFQTKTSYTSNNYTFGFKYQPLTSMTLRASIGTAFLPPTSSQLVPDPAFYTTDVIDPISKLTVSGVRVNYGGNPDLQPQSSTSKNIGLIWEPQQRGLQGLRVNAEYYRTQQYDQISSLGPQALLDAGTTYIERIVRDSTGRVVAVDDSLLNLYKSETEGWDLSIDYRFKTRMGTLDLRTAHTYIMHEARQHSVSSPLYDYAGYVAEGGPSQLKGNLGMSWTYRDMSLGWTTYYFGSYKQYGAAGGPTSLNSTPPGSIVGSTIALQGSQSIPLQMYHDLFASYSFGSNNTTNTSRASSLGSQLLSGLLLQVGIKNVFNTIPPFDANYGGTYYISPYGDKRLRSYWINVSKQF